MRMQDVGVAYSSPQADISCDAHAIPVSFREFDAGCISGFEHLYNPFLAAVEVGRVLQAGGPFFSVSCRRRAYHDSYSIPHGVGVLTMLAQPVSLGQMWPRTPCRLSRSWGIPEGPACEDRARVSVRQGALSILAPRSIQGRSANRHLDELYRAASIGFVTRTR